MWSLLLSSPLPAIEVLAFLGCAMAIVVNLLFTRGLSVSISSSSSSNSADRVVIGICNNCHCAHEFVVDCQQCWLGCCCCRFSCDHFSRCCCFNCMLSFCCALLPSSLWLSPSSHFRMHCKCFILCSSLPFNALFFSYLLWDFTLN